MNWRVNNMKDESKQLAKPEIGLMPIKIHNTLRADNILLAMRRYLAANKGIPKEWIAELHSLSTKI
jgi:hypothetical protein